MLKRMRRHLNPTSLMAILALVFTMSGVAWAANKYIITSTNQIKPSVLAQLEGGGGEGTLPAGATETGLWSTAGWATSAAINPPRTAISFPQRLTFNPTAIYVPPAESEEPGEVPGCPGSRSTPAADAGNLCIYALGAGLEAPNTIFTSLFLDPTSGVLLTFEYEPGETEGIAFGSWAVTAP